jgi:hypothetical protein
MRRAVERQSSRILETMKERVEPLELGLGPWGTARQQRRHRVSCAFAS